MQAFDKNTFKMIQALTASPETTNVLMTLEVT